MIFVFLWDTWAAVASILLVFGKGVFFKVDTGATDKVIVYQVLWWAITIIVMHNMQSCNLKFLKLINNNYKQY